MINEFMNMKLDSEEGNILTLILLFSHLSFYTFCFIEMISRDSLYGHKTDHTSTMKFTMI